MNNTFQEILDNSLLRYNNFKDAVRFGLINTQDFNDLIEPVVNNEIKEMNKLFKFLNN